MSCSDNIQFLRKRKGLTQEQFAEALGVTRQSVSKWESGQSYPEMEKLVQMCDLFGCDLETLVRGSADAAAFRPGQRVRHSILGTGTMLELDEAKQAWLIRFDGLPTPRRISFRARLTPCPEQEGDTPS